MFPVCFSPSYTYGFDSSIERKKINERTGAGETRTRAGFKAYILGPFPDTQHQLLPYAQIQIQMPLLSAYW